MVSNKTSSLLIHCMVEELIRSARTEANPQNLTSLLYSLVPFTAFNHMLFSKEESEMILDQVVSFLSHPNKTIRNAAQKTLASMLYQLEDAKQKQILDRFEQLARSEEEKGVGVERRK